MGRIVAIDYGTKRTGVAVTDPLQIIATALDTVCTSKLLSFLESYFQKEKIDHLVMGFPKKMNGQDSEIVPFIIKLVSKLKTVFPTVPISFVDERLTSRIAHQTMIDGNMKKKERRKKDNVDKISAVLILQSYLASSK